MKKGELQKFIDKRFKGNMAAAAIEMVIMFCKEYDIAGSAAGYDLYKVVQEAFTKALEDEKENAKRWENYAKN